MAKMTSHVVVLGPRKYFDSDHCNWLSNHIITLINLNTQSPNQSHSRLRFGLINEYVVQAMYKQWTGLIFKSSIVTH